MFLVLTMPAFGGGARATGLAARLHAEPGQPLRRGDPLIDLVVDVSGGLARDCPPVSTNRIIVQEALWLRQFHVLPGERIKPGDRIASFSVERDAPDEPPVREPRIEIATILSHSDWWSEAE